MVEKMRFAPRKIVAGVITMLFVSSAHSQSGVTLYGIVDAGLLYTSKTLNSHEWTEFWKAILSYRFRIHAVEFWL